MRIIPVIGNELKFSRFFQETLKIKKKNVNGSGLRKSLVLDITKKKTRQILMAFQHNLKTHFGFTQRNCIKIIFNRGSIYFDDAKTLN